MQNFDATDTATEVGSFRAGRETTGYGKRFAEKPGLRCPAPKGAWFSRTYGIAKAMPWYETWVLQQTV